MIPHTPGPWHIGKSAGAVVADVPIEDGVTGTGDVEYYGGHLVAETVALCNRPLIAAAPELLEACKRLLRFNEELAIDVGVSTHYPSADFARAVIAKAEE